MLAMVAVAAITALFALPVTMIYFERRLPPETAALVEEQLRGGEFDGAFELVLLMTLTAAIGASLGALLARRITKPLSEVSAAARRVASGELSARPRVHPRQLTRRDETAGLLRDFIAMAEALQHLESERQASAAAIAHELRTPLTVLQSRLEAARDGLLAVDSIEIETLLQQTTMLARLVNDLRTLTLADAGRLTLHLQEVKLAALLERTVISFASQADARGVTLQLVVHDHERRDPLLIDVDPDRLAQVLTNVIDNAVHHTPEGGHIRLDARRAEAVIHIEVRDNGPGFREADVSKVFERFYRADTSRSRALGQGSGLGLALVKSITELHGGRVTAANVQNGTGAVIAIELPAPN